MNAPARLETQQQVKLRVEDFFALDEVGAFAPHERTELIDGSIYVLAPQHRPHANLKMALYDALREALVASGSQLKAVIEATVAMPPHDAPEPDLIVTSEPYGEGPIPLPSVSLLIEVASTTLSDDLGIKQRTYATHGVPEYWVADVNERVVHQMWRPDGDEYRERRTIALDQPLSMGTIAEVKLAPLTTWY